MKVKMSIDKMLTVDEGLTEILNQDLPVKIAYRLGRIKSCVESEKKHFGRLKNDLLKKYGEDIFEAIKQKEKRGEITKEEADKQRKGIQKGMYKIKPENIEAFNEDYNSLMESEIEIDTIPLKVSELENEKYEGLKISGASMSKIMPFIEEEDC